MVGSAVIQETVNEVLSRIKEGYAEKSDANEHIQRMEMAHIKLEAALETSNMWNVTSAPLLRWRSKLKRAAQECDHTLRQCRQRFQEEEEVQQAIQRSSFPMRVAHTAMSFLSSIFSSGNNNKLTGSTTVRRFERFADGATEFLRYVELGGTPCRYMFSVPLVRHLLAGKGTKYCFVRGSQHLSFLLQPFRTHDHGVDGNLALLLEDSNASENNFLLALNLRLSESIDVVGVAVSCLQLFIPHLSSTVEAVKTKLTQLPTQDLCWVSSVCERQNNLYSAPVQNGFNGTRFVVSNKIITMPRATMPQAHHQNHCSVIYTWNQLCMCTCRPMYHSQLRRTSKERSSMKKVKQVARETFLI